MIKIILLFLSLSYASIAIGQEPSNGGASILLREDFHNLDDWEPLTFPKIKQHSKYKVIEENGVFALQAISQSSASGLKFRKQFNIKEFPIVRWKWKVTNTLSKGDATKKSGDDYPIRIYINYKYNPETASFGEGLKYGAAKTLYGEYPPHSALNYVWANKKRSKEIITSPYSDRVKMIPIDSGDEKLDQWVSHEVNVLEDYKRAFGEEPPAEASLAIMSDSDNTAQSTQAFIEFIEVRSR